MRQIVLDTETTGLETADGHRIIEIGAVEIVNRRLTGNTFHHYLNPERDIDVGASEVHGITLDDLRDKPRFAEVVEDLLTFVRDSELVIHNAPFDIGFLNHELGLLSHGVSDIATICKVRDTLHDARRMHPGQKNSLDALCRRYDIDNSQRQYHGALLDAEILADVYLAMTGGQATLSLDSAAETGAAAAAQPIVRPQTPLKVIRATAEELAEHAARLSAIDEASGGQCIWKS
ncbi:MAG TPA: DNA polymerase III subunit epsilon [Gammaproteobacteria bacterium]|jgi:DNA polymerase-3 subunit epsilon|nr:DNA polymerase III subunit epsilon [Gammaproteobacteria bacterium]